MVGEKQQGSNRKKRVVHDSLGVVVHSVMRILYLTFIKKFLDIWCKKRLGVLVVGNTHVVVQSIGGRFQIKLFFVLFRYVLQIFRFC